MGRIIRSEDWERDMEAFGFERWISSAHPDLEPDLPLYAQVVDNLDRQEVFL